MRWSRPRWTRPAGGASVRIVPAANRQRLKPRYRSSSTPKTNNVILSAAQDDNLPPTSTVRALLPEPVICDTDFESPDATTMGNIHVLSENVANQIAAGEVVERPASVAKELLENSLDAGATRIRIQVEAGGKKLIQITVNGCGMVRDHALLAFERHAPSKIKDTDDLLSISTLGFRGEALPSIASVARLHLETRAQEEAAGTVLEINGGKIIPVEKGGETPGPSVPDSDPSFSNTSRQKCSHDE